MAVSAKTAAVKPSDWETTNVAAVAGDEAIAYAVTRSLAAVRESLEGRTTVDAAVAQVRSWLRKAFGPQGAAFVLSDWARRLERQARAAAPERSADQHLISLYHGERRKSLWARRIGDVAMEIVGAALPVPPGAATLALAGEAVASISTAIYSWMGQPAQAEEKSVEGPMPRAWRATDPVWRRWAEATLLEAVEAYLADHESAADAAEKPFGPAVRTAATL